MILAVFQAISWTKMGRISAFSWKKMGRISAFSWKKMGRISAFSWKKMGDATSSRIPLKMEKDFFNDKLAKESSDFSPGRN